MSRVIAALRADARGALGFFTRLPVTCDDASPRSLRLAPLAGVAVGAIAALVLVVAARAGLSPPVAALLTLAASLVLTGALHEDGLADVADALGARTRERRLEIMRDSRIGTYGVAALVVALGLKAALLVELAAAGPWAAAGALVMAATLSRAACLWPLHRLPPARGEGLGAWGGRLPGRRVGVAALVAAIVLVALSPFTTGPLAALAGALLAALVTETVTRAARRAFGGQTGDVAGATQVVSELAFLLSVSILV